MWRQRERLNGIELTDGLDVKSLGKFSFLYIY